MTTLLLVEDDHELAGMMKDYLEQKDLHVIWIDNGDDAIAQLRCPTAPIDLVVLDIMLPGTDGVGICQWIRQHGDTPILMLTACDDDETQVRSLELGADNYLTKPVRPHVLLAHIQSMLRRSIPHDNPQPNHEYLTVQDITFDRRTLSATLSGEPLELSDAERDLLEYLLQHPGQTLSRDQLSQALRGLEYDGLDRSIDMRVSSLRKKLNDTTPPFRYLKTVRGKGYLLVK